MGIHQGGEGKQVVLYAFINSEHGLHIKKLKPTAPSVGHHEKQQV